MLSLCFPVQLHIPHPLLYKSVVILVKEKIQEGGKERNEGKGRCPGGHTEGKEISETVIWVLENEGALNKYYLILTPLSKVIYFLHLEKRQ